MKTASLLLLTFVLAFLNACDIVDPAASKEQMKPIATLQLPETGNSVIACGDFIVAMCDDGQAIVFRDTTEVSKFSVFFSGGYAYRVFSDGVSRIAVSGQLGASLFELSDVGELSFRGRLDGWHNKAVTAVAFGDNRIFTAGEDGRLIRWIGTEKDTLYQFDEQLTGVVDFNNFVVATTRGRGLYAGKVMIIKDKSVFELGVQHDIFSLLKIDDNTVAVLGGDASVNTNDPYGGVTVVSVSDTLIQLRIRGNDRPLQSQISCTYDLQTNQVFYARRFDFKLVMFDPTTGSKREIMDIKSDALVFGRNGLMYSLYAPRVQVWNLKL